MFEWFAQNIWWIVAICVVALVMAGLGYYTAATDLEAERKRARAQGVSDGLRTGWDEGYAAASNDHMRSTTLRRPVRITESPYRRREPFSRTAKSGAPNA